MRRFFTRGNGLSRLACPARRQADRENLDDRPDANHYVAHDQDKDPARLRRHVPDVRGRLVIRKTARNVTAVVCLLIGIAGLFLPFIQGIAMIILAVVIADFEAKERLLERYRHTRIGSHLWHRHEARKARDAARNGGAPVLDPEPDSETLPQSALESDRVEK
jgi:hypothetical protein